MPSSGALRISALPSLPCSFLVSYSLAVLSRNTLSCTFRLSTPPPGKILHVQSGASSCISIFLGHPWPHAWNFARRHTAEVCPMRPLQSARSLRSAAIALVPPPRLRPWPWRFQLICPWSLLYRPSSVSICLSSALFLRKCILSRCLRVARPRFSSFRCIRVQPGHSFTPS